MSMTKDERERIERLEDKLEEHLKNLPAIISQHQTELTGLWNKLNQVGERLFGNGTKKGSIEDRLVTVEVAIETVKERQWTNEDHKVFEDNLKEQLNAQSKAIADQLRALKVQLRMPWIILTNLILAAGAAAAVITLFVHTATH